MSWFRKKPPVHFIDDVETGRTRCETLGSAPSRKGIKLTMSWVYVTCLDCLGKEKAL